MPFFTIEPGFTETEEVETTETVEVEAETQASSVTTVDLCACGENCEYGDGCPCECTSEEECDCAECKGCICSNCTNLECTCTCTNEESCTCDSCMKMFDIQYDEYGNLLSIKIAGKDASQYLSMFTARSFSANGNYMASSTDENGKITTYDYNETNGVLDSVTDPRSNVTEYTYDAIGALTQVSTPVSNLAKEGTLIKYTPDSLDTMYGYKDDKLTSITHNDFTYYIKYDQWGNVSKVYVGGLNALTNTNSAEYTYGTGENRNRLESVTYGNGGTVLYVYDDYDRITKISYDGGATYRFVYGYDTLGNVTYVIDNSNSITTFYNENSTEVYKGESLLYYSGYDENGDLFEYEGGFYNYTTKELESTRNPITGYTTTNTQIGDEHSQANLLKTTDKFSRTRQKAIQLRDLRNTESSAFTSVVTDYTYKTYGDNDEYADGQVDTIKSYVTYGEDTSEENIIKEYGLSYRYDDNGNITHEYSVDSNNVETLRYRYTYDEANQITRVDDNIQSKTYVYQYDKGGNRVSEKIYAYTLSDSLGTVQQEIVSEYDNIVWDDLLTSYNGKEITYDNAGNPTSYDGKTFVWNGKQLKQITAADGSKTLFNYDANGLRTRKVQYDETNRLSYYVEYIWADGKIVSQYLTLIAYVTYSDGSTKSVPIGPIPSKIIYDDNGIPQGFTCGESNFGFVRNLQGDVIAMVDFEGNIVMEYSYDPWGNIEYHFNEEVTTEEEAVIYTALCPLTYRGYNYDFTTGLYYLQSRYYNPEWGRFLNCDDTAILLATQGETHNANLFAYCNNNPVNKSDPTGYWAEDVHSGYSTKLPVFGKDKYKYYGNGYIAYNKNKKEYYGTYWWAISVGFSHEHAKIIGEKSYEVDSEFSPLDAETQGWHFNVSASGETDSRIIIMTFMLIAAYSCFDEALKCNENSKTYNDYLKEGLKYLGYALHPIQDYYAHTDDRVYEIRYVLNVTHVVYINGFPITTKEPEIVVLKSHVGNWDTDSAQKRWGQVQKTATITKKILTETYKLYGTLFGG